MTAGTGMILKSDSFIMQNSLTEVINLLLLLCNGHKIISSVSKVQYILKL
jgi:hypothetical protein